MKKRVLVLFGFLLFLGLAGIFLLRFLGLSKQLPSPILNQLTNNPVLNRVAGNGDFTQASATVDGVTYTAISHIPEFSLTGAIDQKQLETYLKRLELLSLANKDFNLLTVTPTGMGTTARKADFKKVTITFLPAAELPAEYATIHSFHLAHLLDEKSDDKLSNGFFAGVSNGDSFDISVYIDYSATQKFALDSQQYLTSSFLKSLYFNFNDQQIKSWRSPSMVFGDKVLDLNTPIFTLKKPSSSLLRNSLLAVQNLVVPQAYAAICGSITCGTEVMAHSGACTGVQQTISTSKCSLDGTACPCAAYSGTCQTTSTTTTTGAGGACTSNADCTAGHGTCNGAQAASCTSGWGGPCVLGGGGTTCNSVCIDCSIGSCAAPVCNTWTAWSACSATCGPGTKSRTNNCGITESLPCNQGSCCGNGACSAASGETCSSCSTDCGVCSPPSGPYCGDGVCTGSIGENCSTCAKDCGVCPPTCTSSCTSSCGQSDGCTGTCPNTDNGTPAAPGGLNPPTNNAVVPVNGQVTLGWNPVPKADLYEIQVYPTGTAAGSECTVANHHCPAPSASNNYTFTADSGVSSYNWRVRAINGTCSVQTGPWSAVSTFTLGGGFSGAFFIDDASTAGYGSDGLCQSLAAIQAPPPGGVVIKANEAGNSTTGVINGSTYSISGVNYNPQTTVGFVTPTGYRCTCPAGCSYSGLSVPKGGVNFYLTNTPAGWWQSANGYIYAGSSTGAAIGSRIPATCASSGTCTAAISQYDSAGTLLSDSTSVSGGGTIDSTDDPSNTYLYLNESKTNTHAENVDLNGPREDYTYFSQLYGITTGSTSNFTGNKPSSSVDAYYSNTSATISNTWTLNTADSIVVFVNGDLTIKKPILVAKGAFVAFIVKGNIIFDKTLGSNTSNGPSVSGVYVADGQIISQSNAPSDDLKLIGEGTFVGWTGIQLQRSFNNGNVSRGNTEPIESFNFRPDFLVTIPERMTKPLYLWQETN